MPQNPEGIDLNEITILGNILYDETGDTFLTVAPQLEPEDFLDPRNRAIYKTFLDLGKKNIPVDPATVSEELKNNKLYDEVGGDAYLELIMRKTTRIAPVENYVNNVKDRSLLNTFLGCISEIRDDAKSKPISDISEFIGKAESSILEITKMRRVAQIVKMKDVSESLVSKLVIQTQEFKKNGRKANGVTGLETGFSNLDFFTKGWQKQNMIVVGARPSVGKTAFALNLLYQVSKRGTPVVFFSLEMSAESIAMRLLSLTSSLSTDEINSLEFQPGSRADHVIINAHSPEEASMANKLQRGLEELNRLPFFIDDNPGSKMLDISTKCKKLKNLIPDVGLMAIDYLGLITTTGKKDNRQAEVQDISRQVKQLARDLDIPIIVLSQLKRESEARDNRKPMMSDLRDSGAIEQDADIILLLYRQDYYSNVGLDNKGQANDANGNPRMEANNPISKVDITLAKNRNGQVGELHFIFDKEHCSFNAVADDGQETPF